MSIDGHKQHQIDNPDPNGAIQIKNQPRNSLMALGCRLIKKGPFLGPIPSPKHTPESIATHQFDNNRTPGDGTSGERIRLEGATSPAAGRRRRPSSCSRGRCSGAPCGGAAPAAAGRSPPPPREPRPRWRRRRRRRIRRAGAVGGGAARPWGQEGEGSCWLWQLGSPSSSALPPLWRGRSAVCLYGGRRATSFSLRSGHFW
jgi:hypothetical protein